MPGQLTELGKISVDAVQTFLLLFLVVPHFIQTHIVSRSMSRETDTVSSPEKSNA